LIFLGYFILAVFVSFVDTSSVAAQGVNSWLPSKENLLIASVTARVSRPITTDDHQQWWNLVSNNALLKMENTRYLNVIQPNRHMNTAEGMQSLVATILRLLKDSN